MNFGRIRTTVDRLKADAGVAARPFDMASLTEEQVAQICAAEGGPDLAAWVRTWRIEERVEFCRRVAAHERRFGHDGDVRIRRFVDQCDRELEEWKHEQRAALAG
jgi:hypothetical protein